MDQIYKQALEMERRVKQYADNPNDSGVQQLWNEVHRMAEEAQMKRGAQVVDTRARGIENRLQGMRSTQAMSPNDVDDLHDRIRDIREDLRKLT